MRGSLLNRYHQMLVRAARPHHIWFLRVRLSVSRVSLHHCFGLTPDDHHMRTRLDPVVVWSSLCCIGVGIACAVVASQHVDEAQLLGCWAFRLPSLGPLHRYLIGTHWCSTRVHTRPPVVALFDDFHLAVWSHVQDRRMVQDVLRCCSS